MPKRTRAHELEAQSRLALHVLFTGAGWTVQDIQHDYGEDLFVRIFNKGRATHWTFFVQAKATDHIESYRSKDGKTLTYPIDRDHLDTWVKFWEPVILTLWDAQSDVTYWIPIQDVLERQAATTTPKKKASVHIPTDNVLDTAALKEIIGLTISRFKRLEREGEGAKTLLKLVEKAWDASVVSYDPQYGSLHIRYNHPADPDHADEYFLFGLGHEMWTAVGAKLVDARFVEAIYLMMFKYNWDQEREKFVIRDAHGTIIRSFETHAEYTLYSSRIVELINAGFENWILPLTAQHIAELREAGFFDATPGVQLDTRAIRAIRLNQLRAGGFEDAE